MLPIELICNVTGYPTWDVTINGTKDEYTLNAVTLGRLPGHNISGDNIMLLIHVPVNNSRYICISNVDQKVVRSDPAFLYIVGKFASSNVIHT